ncbi:MAG: type II toxin-antitoxin system VapC family toxin [Thermoprotei archaeon]
MKRLVLDAGVILGFLEGKFYEAYEGLLNGDVEAYVSSITLAEVKYVLCRKLGEKRANEVFEKLVNSGLFHVVDVLPEVVNYASECKCRYKIALGDCFTIATAKYLGTKALFREESELKGLNVPEVTFVKE